MNIEYKERDLNPPDFEPIKTFDDLTPGDQREMLNVLFMNDQSNALVDMHDTERLHNVAAAIHKAWQFKHGVRSCNDTFEHLDLLDDILTEWDKALSYVLERSINNELKYIHECKLSGFSGE
ncbi:MAG: hypothetical protein AMQ22_00696 [Candidatus Methanofastidiosum methylothiophilum]|uniref:Uncharacterized protein n=1 Tax=Candidatus Methanofastidiosum methylothiophilum TaxID=1705564 RepID=A0A150J606_9EURY|nr:MAG: hypothetical protein AMQ22_00696 [Candidatus Methanofastidiosum methylthiophilus]